MKPAVFLDRDGVINKEVHYLSRADQLKVLPGVARAIKKLNESGFLVVVITNQGHIAKGILHPETLDEIHAVLIDELEKSGARLDAVYYCPHNPDGINKELAIVCECRKPNIGMIAQALTEHDIDVSRSFLIGDRTPDIEAGYRAGLRTILVKTGYGGSDGKHQVAPDCVAADLSAAVDYILQNEQ